MYSVEKFNEQNILNIQYKGTYTKIDHTKSTHKVRFDFPNREW